jgi:hypothetical protein
MNKKSILDMDLLFEGDIWSLLFGYAVEPESDIVVIMPRVDLPCLLSSGLSTIHTLFFLNKIGILALLLIIKSFFFITMETALIYYTRSKYIVFINYSF